MSFSVSDLQDHVAANAIPYLLKVHFGNVTSSLIPAANKIKGVKTSHKLTTLTTTVNFQDGNACGNSSNNTTTLANRTITVGYVEDVDRWCEKDLRAKFDSSVIGVGNTDNESLLQEAQIAEDKIATVADETEIGMWIGDTGRASGNYKWFNGFINSITGGNASISATTNLAGESITATSISYASGYTIVNGVIDKIPTYISRRKDLYTFVGVDTFKKYKANLTAQNLYHFDPSAAKEFKIEHPNSNVTVIATPALDGTDYVVATYLENMYEAGDNLADEKAIKFWYSDDDNDIKSRISFAKGVQFFDLGAVVFWRPGA